MIKSRRKKLIVGAVVVVAAAVAAAMYLRRLDIFYWYGQREPLPEVKTADESELNNTTDLSALPANSTQKSVDPPRQEKIETPLPVSYNLKVPFTSQAPFAVWDHKDEEACEEASLLMAHRYFAGRSISDPDDARSGIDQIIEWEKANLGGVWESTTAAEVTRIAKELLGYQNARVLPNPSIVDIKKLVAAGNPVLAPAYGRALGNPFFKQPGPLYHMMVIKGYDEDEFITNDPGTRRGADYRYRFQTVMDANHDWNGGDVGAGARVMMVLK